MTPGATPLVFFLSVELGRKLVGRVKLPRRLTSLSGLSGVMSITLAGRSLRPLARPSGLWARNERSDMLLVRRRRLGRDEVWAAAVA